MAVKKDLDWGLNLKYAIKPWKDMLSKVGRWLMNVLSSSNHESRQTMVGDGFGWQSEGKGQGARVEDASKILDKNVVENSDMPTQSSRVTSEVGSVVSEGEGHSQEHKVECDQGSQNTGGTHHEP